ncbi:glycerate dehydrogenase [Bacteroidia bacterium]|nr:glycerate dehydrogenase [Bacteroidia bacterium]
MKIVVLEKIEISAEQKARLEKCGQVEYFDNSTQEEAVIRTKDADVAVVNWVDPTDFILSMKNPSLIALMSTGYAWIQHREQARKNGCLIANIPDFATEAVAEHIVGLILSSSKKITIGDREIRGGLKRRGTLRGFELHNKKAGIIGLGKIGKRVAEILQGGFGMEIITYNRTPKNSPNIKDVDLDTLLSESDIVCVTCSLTSEATNMIDCKKLQLLKQDAVVVGTTWGVVKATAISKFLNDRPDVLFGFDAAIEGDDINLKQNLLSQQNITLTPHIAFDTNEALIRQVDICISNIEAFVTRKEKNVIN